VQLIEDYIDQDKLSAKYGDIVFEERLNFDMREGSDKVMEMVKTLTDPENDDDGDMFEMDQFNPDNTIDSSDQEEGEEEGNDDDDDDDDDDVNFDFNTDEDYQELRDAFDSMKSKDGKVQVSAFKKWDVISELIEDEYITEGDLRDSISEVGVKGNKLDFEQFVEVFESLEDKAVGEDEDDNNDDIDIDDETLKREGLKVSYLKEGEVLEGFEALDAVQRDTRKARERQKKDDQEVVEMVDNDFFFCFIYS
jgi:hypothetical protein